MAEVQLQVFDIISEKRDQHGYKFGHYSKYRKYCGRKVHKLRRLHKIQPFTAYHKVRNLPAEAFDKPGYLEILLFQTERVISFAQECDEDANETSAKKDLRKRKLKKAITYASRLREFCFNHASENEGLSFKVTYDTWSEILAYHAYVTGYCLLKLGKYKRAFFYLKTAKQVYETLLNESKDSKYNAFNSELLENVEAYFQKCLYYFRRTGISNDFVTSALYLQEVELNQVYLSVLQGKQIEKISSLLAQTNIENSYKIFFFSSERTFTNPPEWLKFSFDKISKFFNINTNFYASFTNDSNVHSSSGAEQHKGDFIYETKLSFSSFFVIPGVSPYIDATSRRPERSLSTFGPLVNPMCVDFKITSASANIGSFDYAVINKAYDDILFEIESMQSEFDKMLKVSDYLPEKEHTAWLKLYFQYTTIKIKISRNFFLIYYLFSKMISESKYGDDINELFEFSVAKKAKWWLKERDQYRPEIFIRLYDSICTDLEEFTKVSSDALLSNPELTDSIKSTYYYCLGMKSLLASLFLEAASTEEALELQNVCVTLTAASHSFMVKRLSEDDSGVDKMTDWLRNLQTRFWNLKVHGNSQKVARVRDIYSILQRNETVSIKETENIESYPSLSPFNAVMIKPVFYDIAGTHVEFSSFEEKPKTATKPLETTQEGDTSKVSGIASFVKGLFWR